MIDWQAITNYFMIVITIVLFIFGAFQWVSMMMLKGIDRKVSAVCEQNNKEHESMKRDNEKQHEEIWERVNHHRHSPKGNVEIPIA